MVFQQYRHPSGANMKWKLPEGLLNTLEGEYVVMTAENLQKTVMWFLQS